MTATTSFDSFAPRYDAGQAQIVWTTLVADLETPVSAFLKLADGQPFTCLFESVEGGSTIGRYSFITLKPDLIWRCTKGAAEINRRARFDLETFEPLEGDPLTTLRALVAESRIDLPPGLPPMASCLLGYLGYDMVRQMERLPEDNPDSLGLPDGLMFRPTVVAVFDRVEDQVTVFTPVWPQPGVEGRAAYAQARERLADIVGDFERSLPFRQERRDEEAPVPEPRSNMVRERFYEIVRRAKDYIFAGDIFQVVLSQRFSVPFHLPPFALYRALRRLNPSPFLFFLNLGDFAVVGSSPEILRHHHPGRPGLGRGPAGRPQGAGRTPHAVGSGPQRRGPGGPGGHGPGDRAQPDRALQPRHAHRLQRGGPDRSQARRHGRASRPARSPAHPRCGPWKSSRSWRTSAGGSTAARWATSAPAATWTPASRSGPRWSRTG
jgi:anthranilate synthase component 1